MVLDVLANHFKYCMKHYVWPKTIVWIRLDPYCAILDEYLDKFQ